MAHREAEASDRTTLHYGAVMVAVVLAIVLGWRWLHRDVEFCQRVFRELAVGSSAAEGHIGWEQLNAMGTDVGLTYTRLPNDKERADYRRTFVQAFGKTFKLVRGTPSAFVNWRVTDRSPERITVATDYQAKGVTLLMTLPGDGKRQVIGLQWDRACESCPAAQAAEQSG